MSKDFCVHPEHRAQCEENMSILRELVNDTMEKLHSGKVPVETIDKIFVALMSIFAIVDKALSLPSAHEECPHMLRLSIANAIGHIIEEVDKLAFGADKVPPPDLSSLLN